MLKSKAEIPYIPKEKTSTQKCPKFLGARISGSDNLNSPWIKRIRTLLIKKISFNEQKNNFDWSDKKTIYFATRNYINQVAIRELHVGSSSIVAGYNQPQSHQEKTYKLKPQKLKYFAT